MDRWLLLHLALHPTQCTLPFCPPRTWPGRTIFGNCCNMKDDLIEMAMTLLSSSTPTSSITSGQHHEHPRVLQFSVDVAEWDNDVRFVWDEHSSWTPTWWISPSSSSAWGRPQPFSPPMILSSLSRSISSCWMSPLFRPGNKSFVIAVRVMSSLGRRSDSPSGVCVLKRLLWILLSCAFPLTTSPPLCTRWRALRAGTLFAQIMKLETATGTGRCTF